MEEHGQEISRRKVLSAAGLAAVAVPLATGRARAASLVRRADTAGAPGPEGVHVQFGHDAASQVAVSWQTEVQVSRPRLRLGRTDSGFGLEVQAQERTYTEVLTGQTVWTYHASLDHLQPDTQYVFEVLNDGAPTAVPGTFRTGPRGRSRGFRFTSFGDQAVPVRGVLTGSTLLTPAPQGTDPFLMDTSTGTVHMIIGGGGHSTPTPVADFDTPHDGVLITSVGPGSPQSPHPAMTTTEPAPWSAYRDLMTPYGFASFDFVPHEPGGTTSITVTHYGAELGSPDYTQRDQFVMRKSLREDRDLARLAASATR